MSDIHRSHCVKLLHTAAPALTDEADDLPRSYSTTPSTRSDYGSGYANGKAVKSLETEAHDDIDVLVDTVRTGPTQEALRYAGSNEEQDQEPDDTPTWDGRW